MNTLGRPIADVDAWLALGTELFLDTADRLNAAIALPGWTRRHVIAHIHHNAEALRRLVNWASTGVATPMYASSQQRAREIEESAVIDASELRRLLRTSAAGLAEDLAALTNWHAEVVTAQGRTVRATEIPWMRTREVVVHAVDLDAGVDFADLPDELNAALAADVLATRCARGEAAALSRLLTGRAPDPPGLRPWL
jgi:maleylpyruvate isomerase